MQDFRELDVWKRAHLHALNVRKATQRFPRRGYTRLIAQILGAAESIPFNIVEGCGAVTRKEFARFLDISVKSNFELEYQLQLAKDYGVVPEDKWRMLTNETVEIRRMTCGLRRKVRAADARDRARRKGARDATPTDARRTD